MFWYPALAFFAGVVTVVAVPPTINRRQASNDTAPSFTANHYEGHWNGSCNYGDYRPSNGLPGASIASRFYLDSQACGGCIKVRDRRTKRSIIAMVVDICENCPNDITLFDEAWAYLAPLSQKILNVDWVGTSCNHVDPLQVEFTSGVNDNYFAARVINSNWPIFNMYIRPTGQFDWGKLVSKDWNVFEGPNLQGAGPVVDIRLDCPRGGEVFLDAVKVQEGIKVTAPSNC